MLVCVVCDWATCFERGVRALIERGDDLRLIEYESFGRDALLSVPTPEHYLPLLYVLALAGSTAAQFRCFL